jgi:hypothetical protein
MISKNIEKYFRDHPGKAVKVGELMRVGKCNAQAVSASISYLNSKARKGIGGIDVETLTRGKVWAYYPRLQLTSETPEEQSARKIYTDEETSERMRQLAIKIGEDSQVRTTWSAAERQHEDERAELLTLRVIGTSQDGNLLGLNEESGSVFKVVPV